MKPCKSVKSVETAGIEPARCSPRTVASDLDDEMRQVLAELELVSQGTTTAYDTSGGAGEERIYPPGGVHPEHDLYRRLYNKQAGDHGREAILSEAREELAHLRGRVQRIRPAGETKKQRDGRCILECAGLALGEAAVKMRMSTTEVRKARLSADRNPADGKRVVVVETWEVEAHRLRASGTSVRAIGQLLGRRSSTVHDVLKRLAA